jgi:hypothetical protein
LDTTAIAVRFLVPEATVRKWRQNGTGPRGVRFGRHVRYALADVEAWERRQVASQMGEAR